MDYGLADRLSRAWSAAPYQKSALLNIARGICGQAAWTAALTRRFMKAFPAGRGRRPSAVRRFLLSDRTFVQQKDLATSGGLLLPAAPALVGRGFPILGSSAAVADWLGLTVGELDWFANLRGWHGEQHSCLRHYRYRWIRKRSGGARLIEAPLPRLKAMQRRILCEILNAVPLHDSAHGFRRGRGILTFTAAHCGQAGVLRLDLRDYFPSVRRRRVAGLFITLGYHPAVANVLSGMCTHATPDDVWDDFPPDAGRDRRWESESLYGTCHLPQGAPTSPAIANACAYRMDARLAGLARAAGAAYTRYADDLLFSGGRDFVRCAWRLVPQIGAIVLDEGFEVNYRKTRLMPEATRQHACGLVLNERANVLRIDFDNLKAILHNCTRFGPQSQNREGHPNFRAHLAGCIAYVAHIHPARGKKLQAYFEKIAW